MCVCIYIYLYHEKTVEAFPYILHAVTVQFLLHRTKIGVALKPPFD